MDRYIQSGPLRCVRPYHTVLRTFVKRRWENRRIIDALVEEFIAFDKEYYEKAISEGKLYVEGKRTTSIHDILKSNQVICHSLHIHEPKIPDVDLEFVFVSSHLPSKMNIVAVNKPFGIPVHPAGSYKYNTLSEFLKALYTKNSSVKFYDDKLAQIIKKVNQKILDELVSGRRRMRCIKQPGMDSQIPVSYQKIQEIIKGQSDLIFRPVHRLDKVTSGLVIFALDKKDASVIQSLFREKRLERMYIARVIGDFRDVFDGSKTKNSQSENVDDTILSSGTLICKKGKAGISKFDPKKPSTNLEKRVETEFRFLCYDKNLDESLILCKPFTGKTHQLRAQLQALNHPITNDHPYNPDATRHLDWFPSVEYTNISSGINPDKNGYASMHPSGIFLHAWRIQCKNHFEVETPLPPWCFESI